NIKSHRLYVKLCSAIHVSMYYEPCREVSAVNTGVPCPKVPIHRKLGHDDAIDFFGARYSTIRQFAPAFLQTLTFHAEGPDDTVLRAVDIIRRLDRAPMRRPIPGGAPMALVTEAWRPYVREPDGSLSRRYYELCTLWSLRSALRAGHVWVAHSRRYTNPDTSLIPPAEWPRWRPEV